jgi:hypothetical protein
MSSRLPLYLIRATINGPLAPSQSRSGQQLRLYPRSRSCSGTRRTTTLRLERDSPGRPSNPLRCSPYRNTCRNSVARMLTAPSLAYKRRGSPPAAGGQTRDDRQQSLMCSPPSPRYWHPPQSNLWDLEATPLLPPRLYPPLYEHHDASNIVPRAHRCWTYGPGRNQDKPSVLSC